MDAEDDELLEELEDDEDDEGPNDDGDEASHWGGEGTDVDAGANDGGGDAAKLRCMGAAAFDGGGIIEVNRD